MTGNKKNIGSETEKSSDDPKKKDGTCHGCAPGAGVAGPRYGGSSYGGSCNERAGYLGSGK